MKVYNLANLDCATCALKIEDGLRTLDSVKAVSVNFATLSLHIDSTDIDEAKAFIKRIEPDVVVSEAKLPEHTDASQIRRELLFIAPAAALLAAALIIERYITLPYPLLRYCIIIPAYLLAGWRVLLTAGRNIVRGSIFDENFLMGIATIGALIIGETEEAVGVMLFYRVGEMFESIAVARSRRSIRSLLAVRSECATLITGTHAISVHPSKVHVGDTIRVKPGEKVPLDGVIIDGTSELNTAALTGESEPRSARIGDSVLSGMINGSATITVQVTNTFENSAASRIVDLVENALSRKANAEKFITRFAHVYTPIVVIAAVLLAVIPPLFITGIVTFPAWIYRALTLLVISCPCAFVISIPLSYFAGIGAAAKQGVLVKGSNFIDVLSKLRTVVFDKTGTLTKGVFAVRSIVPSDGMTPEGLLSIAAAAESHSNHPIARSILERYGAVDEHITDHREHPGFGIIAAVNGKRVIAGNDRLLHREGIEHPEPDDTGTIVHIAVDGRYAGHIIIADVIKENARAAVDGLTARGITSIMLTGDSAHAAAYVAKYLGIDTCHAELLPDQKVARLEDIMKDAKHRPTAFVGDGINDAPVIARADAGLAMGFGTDAAIEVADVVLMSHSPDAVLTAVDISRRTQAIVRQNVGIAFGIKIAFIALGAVGLMTMWGAVFADIGVALIAILNATRVLRTRTTR